ncbi:MAG: hypothetical protein MJ219_04450 [Mycoplasmoidaceae bacterium]|nr:hypothetical protein [Mycoplasmoidaceae bacterium]
MYSKQEGILDYYCLPIEIYDYRHHLITDPTEKARCYSQLHVEMSSYHHTYARPEYDIAHDCIKIKFSKDDLYTPYEMYENKFELKYKNVTINIETPSKLARAKYEFIPVQGINVYCQDAFMNRKNAVLQSNVGLEDDAKDNIPYKRNDELNHLGTVYGNGYTACFESSYLADNIYLGGLINTTMKGASDAQIKAGADFDFEFSKMGDGD